MKMSPPKLFGDEDEEFPQDEGFSKFEIDENYARRLDYNRKREDLQRYEELRKKGLIAEDDDDDYNSEEEESEPDDDIVDTKFEREFFENLLKVKRQDPSLKNKDVKLYQSSESDEKEKEIKKKDQKKMYLKDVQAKHLLEEGPDYVEGGLNGVEKKKGKSFVEQQEELKKELCDAVEAAGAEIDEEDDDLFKVKESKGENDLEEDEELVKKVDEYFGEDAQVDENTKFLRDFFVKKMWEDKDGKGKSVVLDDAELDALEDDEDLVDMAELYETTYRHEENVEDLILGQSRKVEGSVRKKDTARKGQRKNKEERMRMAELERQEELKQLKNIKKKEIKEKMKKVLSVAGFKDGDECRLDGKDLDDDFNPEEYDNMMKKVFDDKYYGEEDSDLNSDDEDCEKPDFDKEDELLGLPKNWEVTQAGDGFTTAREMALKHKVNNDDDDEEEEEEVEEEVEREEGKRKRKRKTSLVQKAKEALMEEYYKLDYEDTIGDLKTRFKYAKVQPNKFELETEEILCLEDTELNQYVPLKKIAPYQEKDWEVNKYKVREQKLKNKELLLQASEKHHEKRSKKKRRSEVVDVVKTKPAPADKEEGADEEEGETSKLSRKAKRRRRQAEKKLAPNRMAAYGKADK